MEDSWDLSLEQRILVRAALDIWGGQGDVLLWEILSELSHKNFSQLISALMLYRHFKVQSFSLDSGGFDETR